jgi:hypothetical protein
VPLLAYFSSTAVVITSIRKAITSGKTSTAECLAGRLFPTISVDQREEADDPPTRTAFTTAMITAR